MAKNDEKIVEVTHRTIERAVRSLQRKLDDLKYEEGCACRECQYECH